PGGETMVQNIMSDEKVEPGERVLTSGGDRVFPKGMPVGVVTDVLPGNDLFLRVRIKPAARLDRLEEVLVITKVEERSPSVEEPSAPMRAVDILAQRLPSVPVKADDQSASKPSPASGVPAPTSNLPPPTRNLPPPAAAGANAAEAAKPKGPTPQPLLPLPEQCPELNLRNPTFLRTRTGHASARHLRQPRTRTDRGL